MEAKEFIREFIRLTRFEHALMYAFAVLIAETILLGTFPPINAVIVLSLLVPIFSEMGAFSLNDYLDMETDKLNKKMNRPLVKGTISQTFALNFAFISLAISTVLAYFINIIAFAIVVVFNLLAVAYNLRLKDYPLVGNFYIALTMAIPFIFGNYVVSDELADLAIILAALGFVAGLAREIIKSAQDMKGDMKARKSKTLPIAIGEGPSVFLAMLLYLIFIPLSAAPFFLGLPIKGISLVLVLAADFSILVICYKIMKQKEYGFARDTSLIAFVLGLAGLFLAAL